MRFLVYLLIFLMSSLQSLVFAASESPLFDEESRRQEGEHYLGNIEDRVKRILDWLEE